MKCTRCGYYEDNDKLNFCPKCGNKLNKARIYNFKKWYIHIIYGLTIISMVVFLIFYNRNTYQTTKALSTQYDSLKIEMDTLLHDKDSLSLKYILLENDYNELECKNDSLIGLFNNIIECYPVIVKEVYVRDTRKKFGETIYSATSTYLQFEMDCLCLENIENATFYIRLYNYAKGTYTNIMVKRSILPQKIIKVDLEGMGSSREGYWNSGNYHLEIFYKDWQTLIAFKRFTIY